MENTELKTLQDIASENGFTYIQIAHYSQILAEKGEIQIVPVRKDGSSRFYKGMNSADATKLIEFINRNKRPAKTSKNKYQGMKKDVLLKKLRLYSKNISLITEALNF